MARRAGIAILVAAAFVGVWALASTATAEAHQSGCHRWHSCPSDTGSYVCGDLGYPCGGGTGPPAPAAGTDTDADGVPNASDSCPFDANATPDGCPPPARRKYSARITAVTDGDTIKVRTSTGRQLRVRLVGIDTPETVKPGTPVECGGRQATAAMQKLSFMRVRGRRLGRRVTLTTDPSQDAVDAYGRLLAYVKTDAGKVLQTEQLRRGWAAVYVFERPFERVDQFRAVEQAARDQGLGVWSACGGDFHRP